MDGRWFPSAQRRQSEKNLTIYHSTTYHLAASTSLRKGNTLPCGSSHKFSRFFNLTGRAGFSQWNGKSKNPLLALRVKETPQLQFFEHSFPTVMEWTPELLTWSFLGGGVVLMLAEAALPGGVSFFLGLSGVLVAALRLLGVLGNPFVAVIVWSFLSLGLVVALRPLATRYFGGDTRRQMTNEDVDALDEVVTVTEAVGGLGEEGRIRFRGAEWRARVPEEDRTLTPGTEARIVYRDNLTWVVEPTGTLPGDGAERRLDDGPRTMDGGSA
jgi:membrane protein implicated in regulation of membrane protease activity